ncbi:MAG: AP-4-A phosphorylase [candidate division WS2 bacterium]|nr:AP-4-A phosphorylase [Candidatus Lithacetigena glycinireducens]MBT9174369.1 AP-4-A phosphorylase [Candidatus Lithacetigena glycinireducens]
MFDEIMFRPWRIIYLQQEKENGCILCAIANSENDVQNLVLLRSKHCFVMLNRYPYNIGHLMVVPYEHLNSIGSLQEGEMVDIMKTVSLSMDNLKTVLNPQGFNLGVNIGKAAGAGIENHIHFHIVPRWEGDTNFMPVISDIKILGEALDDTYRRLKGVFS